MSELKHYWWEERDDGYQVDVKKLLFSITLTELCIVEILHTCNSKYPEMVPREILIERWKAQILNLRKIPKMLVVRAAYYQWFNKKGDTRETYPERWRAAWDTANYYFKCDIETAWEDLTIEDLKIKQRMIKLTPEKHCQISGKPCINHENGCSLCPVMKNTKFTCPRCGEKWNLLSDPTAETDTCPKCGITVKSDKGE